MTLEIFIAFIGVRIMMSLAPRLSNLIVTSPRGSARDANVRSAFTCSDVNTASPRGNIETLLDSS
jgi:hypothetical protein